MTVPVDDNDSADLSAWFDSTIAFIGKFVILVILLELRTMKLLVHVVIFY